MLQAVNYFIRIYASTFKAMKAGKAWLYLLLIGLINFIILLIHYNFSSSMFYGLMAWWTEFLNHDFSVGFTHYPGHLMLLPYYFYRAKLFLGFFIEGALLGAASLAIFYFINKAKMEKKTIAQLGINWLNLSVGWLIINGCMFLLGKYLPMILESLLKASPRRQMFFDYAALPLLNIIILALFFFVIPFIAINNVNAFKAAWSSIKLFFKRPIFCFFLSLTVLLIPVLVSYLLLNQQVIINKFNPELIYWIVLLGLIVDIPVNFIWLSNGVHYLNDLE